MLSEQTGDLSPAEIAALRLCAVTCWQKRVELRLDDAALEQVLVACMAAASSPEEGEAAAAVLAARREADRKQARFDELLGGS